MQLLFESLPPDPGGETSVSMKFSGNRNRCPVPGILYNTNTQETFNALDRQALFKLEVEKIWEDIHSGRVEEDSGLLCRFLLISFADLKKWRFYYWFAFPALVLKPSAVLTALRPASEVFNQEEGTSLLAACKEWRGSTLTAGVPFFLVHMVPNVNVRVRPLRDWEACQEEGGKVMLGFYDPCHLPSNPGWPLRNFLAFAAARWGLERARILCYREKRGLGDLQQCLIADVLISIPQGWSNSECFPEAVGWEQNSRGKMECRCINLATYMDPNRLAIAAADLNLKLMRWRALPSLNLPLLWATKCLLLGAGTLGCQVARSLMAWGVRHITLVDCGRVAMSNPLRQSLYTIDDCLDGGKLKPNAAADSLKHIFPAITAALGFDSFLVMRHGAGVAVPSDTQIPPAQTNVECKLSEFEDLVDLEELEQGEQRLGCYFCTDVVAPVDSTANRTLDQQCTVTRPGLAPIAASLAVELTVGIIHHPLGINAPADNAIPDDSSIEQPLGILPHQIRGDLAKFSQLIIKGHSFNSSTNITVCIQYNGEKQRLIINVKNESAISFPSHPILSDDIDLSSYLDDEVYVGFAASTGFEPQINTILAWNFTIEDLSFKTATARKRVVISASSISFLVFIVTSIVAVVLCSKKYKNSRAKRDLERTLRKNTDCPRRFRLKDIKKATNNFHPNYRLGYGGCGEVYKGILPTDNTLVAVKKLFHFYVQSKKDFVEEAKTISRLRHRNLVPLLGWCYENQELILVYHLMPNGSLDKLIFNRNESDPVLSWDRRYQVLCGVASALLYLHEEFNEQLIHRDIKASNIMLDSDYEARLGDFGLARFIKHGKSSYTVSKIAGTLGYLAPECISGRASRESDVFSFGAVILEVVCGRPPMLDGETHLVDLVWRLYGQGTIRSIVDPRFCGAFDEEEAKCAMLVGLACCHPQPHERPTIRQVCEVLAKKAPPPFVPVTRPPTGFTPPSSSIIQIVS